MLRFVHRREIPKNLIEGMKLLNPNTGQTTLVYLKDENTVRCFTRDAIKFEWHVQSWGLDIGGKHCADWFRGYAYPEIEIRAYEAPRLYKLSRENKKHAENITNAVLAVPHKRGARAYEVIHAAMQHVSAEVEYEILENFEYFIANYDESQFRLDFSVHQFMQTREGVLILNDPVVCKEMLEEVEKRRKSLKQNRMWQMGRPTHAYA